MGELPDDCLRQKLSLSTYGGIYGSWKHLSRRLDLLFICGALFHAIFVHDWELMLIVANGPHASTARTVQGCL